MLRLFEKKTANSNILSLNLKLFRTKVDIKSVIRDYSFRNYVVTGVAISSNCTRTQFLFQRHNFNVTDLLLKTLEQKAVPFFL